MTLLQPYLYLQYDPVAALPSYSMTQLQPAALPSYSMTQLQPLTCNHSMTQLQPYL